MENYILIKVTEPDTEGSTQAAFLRRHIHRFANEHGIQVADNLIKENMKEFLWGAPVPYEEAQELFKKISHYKEV